MKSSSVTQKGEKWRSFLPKRGSSIGRQQESPLCVGDVVLVNGVKRGQLLYRGETSFAAGTWCGVELETPDGKHDGVVEGRRYFRCASQHGIFVPLSRVTLDRQSTGEVGGTAVRSASNSPQREVEKTVRKSRQEVGGLKRKATTSKLRRVSANVRAAEAKNVPADAKVTEGRLTARAGRDSSKRGRLRQRVSARSQRQRNTCASDASSETSSVSPRPSSRPSSPRVDTQTALTLTYVGDSDSDNQQRLDSTFRMTSPTRSSSCDNAGEWDGVFSSNMMASSMISNASSLGLLTDDQLQDITLTTATDWVMSGASTPQGVLTPSERLSPIPHSKFTAAPFQTSTPSSWKVTETGDETFYVLDPNDRIPSPPSDIDSQHGSPFDSINALDESMEIACTAVAQYAALVEGAEREGEVQARLNRRRQQCREEKERMGRLQRSIVVAELHGSMEISGSVVKEEASRSAQQEGEHHTSGDSAVVTGHVADDISFEDSLSSDNPHNVHTPVQEQNGDDDQPLNVTSDLQSMFPSALSAAAVGIIIDDASPLLKPCDMIIFDDSSGCELSNDEFRTDDYSGCELSNDEFRTAAGHAKERPASFLSTCSVGTDILDEVTPQCHQKGDRPFSVVSLDDAMTSSGNDDDVRSETKEPDKPCLSVEQVMTVVVAEQVLEDSIEVCPVSDSISDQQDKVAGYTETQKLQDITNVMNSPGGPLLTVEERIPILNETFTRPIDEPDSSELAALSSDINCQPSGVDADVSSAVAMDTNVLCPSPPPPMTVKADDNVGGAIESDTVDNAGIITNDQMNSSYTTVPETAALVTDTEADRQMDIQNSMDIPQVEDTKQAVTMTDNNERLTVDTNAMETSDMELDVDMTTCTDKGYNMSESTIKDSIPEKSHNMSDSTIKDSVPEKCSTQPKAKTNTKKKKVPTATLR